MNVTFSGSYITLAQFLKKLDFVSSGGETKIFLESKQIKVNGEKESRRGRKLVAGDSVVIDGTKYILKGHSDELN